MQQVVSLEYLRLIHGSVILDNIWTQFLGGGRGGDLYVGATYRRVYTVVYDDSNSSILSHEKYSEKFVVFICTPAVQILFLVCPCLPVHVMT